MPLALASTRKSVRPFSSRAAGGAGEHDQMVGGGRADDHGLVALQRPARAFLVRRGLQVGQIVAPLRLQPGEGELLLALDDRRISASFAPPSRPRRSCRRRSPPSAGRARRPAPLPNCSMTIMVSIGPPPSRQALPRRPRPACPARRTAPSSPPASRAPWRRSAAVLEGVVVATIGSAPSCSCSVRRKGTIHCFFLIRHPVKRGSSALARVIAASRRQSP